MLKLRKFKLSDIEHLRPEAIDGSVIGRPEYCRTWAKLNIENGPAYTAYINNEIVGSAGIRLTSDNEGVLWAVFSTKMKDHIKGTLRSSRELISALIIEFNLKTIYALSRKGFAAPQRMLEHLGFERMNEEPKTDYYYKLEI